MEPRELVMVESPQRTTELLPVGATSWHQRADPVVARATGEPVPDMSGSEKICSDDWPNVATQSRVRIARVFTADRISRFQAAVQE